MITDQDFQEGSLSVTSYTRPGKLFTANRELISGQAGILENAVLEKMIDAVIHCLNQENGVRPLAFTQKMSPKIGNI
jgi:hypothetical protein